MSKKKNNPAQMDLFAMTENVENVKAAQEAAPVLDVLDIPDGAKIDPEPSDFVKQIVETAEKSEPEETAKPEPEKKAVKAKRATAKKGKTAKVAEIVETFKDEKPIGTWDTKTWSNMRDKNNDNMAQFMVAAWAAKNATAEREEFALLMDDYAYICNEGRDKMTADLYDFRNDLYDELRERVTRVYGEAKWAECAACL